MSYPISKLGDVAEFINGYAFKPSDWQDEGVDIVRIQNLTDPAKKFNKTKLNVDGKYHVYKNDILVSWSATLDVFVWKNDLALLNQHIFKVVPKLDYIDPDYLLYVLRNSISSLMKYTRGSTMKHINRGDFLNTKIPLPPLEIQKQIAAILSKADSLRQDCAQMSQELNTLAQAVFMDMFGDPVTNPKGWKLTTLPEHGSFKNGLNYNKGESGVFVKYLGVGNFKSLASISDMDTLEYVELNDLPQEDYLLASGDLVFVRSNGNKALVGRCISVYPNGENLTFSGFCIRYRVESKYFESEYLNYLFRTSSIKQTLLGKGQGANIQNINQKMLFELAIPQPPKELQIEFVKEIRNLRNHIKLTKNQHFEIELFFEALTQKAFSGQLELTPSEV